MKVILERDIANVGKRGDVKEVADGYAINVLIRKGDAIHATPAELAKWKQKHEAKAHKKERATSAFAQLAESLHNNKIVITGKKADQKGQLFASIKESDIADAIYATVNISVDPKQVILPAQIKHIGVHEVIIKQGERKEVVQVEVR